MSAGMSVMSERSERLGVFGEVGNDKKILTGQLFVQRLTDSGLVLTPVSFKDGLTSR